MFRSKITGLAFPLLIILLLLPCFTTIESKCSKGCDLALGSYYILPGSGLPSISQLFDNSIDDIISYNSDITRYYIKAGTRINIPFTCNCIDGEFLGHVFPYLVQSGDTYDKIAQTHYLNLTTAAMLARFNGNQPSLIPENVVVKVPVNCSCGNTSVSEAYGLFITYPLRVEDSLESIAAAESLSEDLLQRYNPGANFSAGSGLVYIPGRDKSGRYTPLKSSTGLSARVIAGICVGVVIGALLVAFSIYRFYRKKKVQEKILLSTRYEDLSLQAGRGLSVDKSVEFSYEELAKATNDFSVGHKIGQGGFGSVYYAELRGECRKLQSRRWICRLQGNSLLN